MEQAFFRFYGSLKDFLPPERHHVSFSHFLKERGSVKDTIEALGVPHPEVALILVNSEPVDFSYLIHDGDRISIYPTFTSLELPSNFQLQPPPPEPIRFVLDIHLGKLATYLRLLGFDALYRNDFSDGELADLSSQEARVLLTQDHGLLKRRLVTYGYFVRHHDPQQQIVEVLQRFNLYGKAAPLRRCLRCNGVLEPVAKAVVSERLPPLTREHYDEFSRCQVCDQIYWKGAHYDRIHRWLDQVLAV